jgi:hypothetical protein
MGGAGGSAGLIGAAGSAQSAQMGGNPQIISSVCTGLDLLTYLIGGPMESGPDKILACIGPLQKGLAACLASPQHKVRHFETTWHNTVFHILNSYFEVL